MKFLVKILFPFICAIYFSLLIGGVVDGTRKQYLILFIFSFFIAKYFLDVFYQKTIPEQKPARTPILLSACLALVLLGSADQHLVPAYKSNKSASFSVTALGEKNEASSSSEVWITGLTNADREYGLDKIRYDSGWEKRDARILSYQHQPSTLTITIDEADAPSIKFLKHAWSGKIKINDGKKETIIDLYQAGDSGESIYHIENLNAVMTGQEYAKQFFYYLLTFAFLLALFYPLIVLTTKNIKNYYVINLLFWVLLFVLPSDLTLTPGEIILLLPVSIVAGILFSKAFENGGYLKNNLSRKEIILLVLIALYAAFACIGNALFLTGAEPTTLRQVSYFIVFAAWFFSIEIAFLYITYKLKAYFKRSANRELLNKPPGIQLWVLIFTILTTTWLIYLLAFFPGVMSSDSLDQWGQAIGVSALNNWHPVFHTLFNRALLVVSKNPSVVAFSQILFMAAVAASFITFLYKKGIPEKWLLLFTLALGLLPSNGINLITLWKDIPFTISLLWLTLVLAKITEDHTYFRNSKSAIPGLVLSLVAVALFRHNGIIVYILAAIALSLYSFKYKNRVIPVCLILSVICIVSFKLLITGSGKVTPLPPEIKLIAPVNGMAAVMKEDHLTPAVQNKMETILTREQWTRLYSPYWANGYQFQTDGAYMKNLSHFTTAGVLQMYATTLYHHPYLLLKDRLQGADILWNVSRPAAAHNSYYNTELEANNYGLGQKKTDLKPALINYLKISETFAVNFLWRAGIYNIFMLLLMFFIAKNGSRRHILLFLPWLGAALSLLPSLLWQEFRYVYFVPLLFGFLWLSAMSDIINPVKRDPVRQ